MSTFALVHGGWHGAWCWERLTPELEALGHRLISLDLPSDDSSASLDDYADVVCAALADVDGDDRVVIGHSLAGQTAEVIEMPGSHSPFFSRPKALAELLGRLV